MKLLRFCALVLGLVTALAALPASAQQMPDATGRAVLIKQTLLTFNDANITGDYSVFRALSAKPFADEYTADKLAGIFKDFHDQAIDLAAIVEFDPVYTSDPIINADGLLQLYGYFDTRPSIVHFELDFAPEEGAWRVLSINVNVAPPDTDNKTN